MEQLQYSITALNEVIGMKLRSLASVTSASDIKEINNFLRESQRLRKTLYSLGDITEDYYGEEEDTVIEGPDTDLDYLGILVQSCEYISGFHSVVDFKKVKETKSQWLLDESAEFVAELRRVFGARIPAMAGSVESRGGEVESKGSECSKCK